MSHSRSLTRLVVLVLCVSLMGCKVITGAPIGVDDGEDQGTPAPVTQDMSSTMDMSEGMPDVDMGLDCEPLPDVALCAIAQSANGIECGDFDVRDTCLQTDVAVSCGCDAGSGCVDGQCIPCEPPDIREVCEGAGSCDSDFAAMDTCGQLVAIDCSRCEDSEAVCDVGACVVPGEQCLAADECGLLEDGDVLLSCGQCGTSDAACVGFSCVSELAACGDTDCSSPCRCQGLETCGENGVCGRVELFPSSVLEGGQFGRAVALHDDLLVVGADSTGPMGQKFGSAYIYRRIQEDARWVQAARLTSEEPGNARFGFDVATNGEVVAISSPFITPNTSTIAEVGKVEIFERNSEGAWLVRQTLTPQMPFGAEHRFGTRLQFVGDQLWIGSAGESDSRIEIFGYKNGSGMWERLAQIAAPLDATEGEIHRFGATFDVARNWAIIGAPAQGISEDRGRVFLFTRSEDADDWTFFSEVVIPKDGVGGAQTSTASGADNFGAQVAISPAASASSNAMMIAVGAPGWTNVSELADAGPFYEGVVHVYHFMHEEADSVSHVSVLGMPENDRADTVTFVSDLVMTDKLLWVGSPLTTEVAKNPKGAVHAFPIDIEQGTLQEPPTTYNPVAIQFDQQFGGAIALWGHLVAVGVANRNKDNVDGVGSVVIFDHD